MVWRSSYNTILKIFLLLTWNVLYSLICAHGSRIICIDWIWIYFSILGRKGILFSIIKFCFYLFIYIIKFYFCNRYAKPVGIGPEMNSDMIDLLDYFPLFFALG